MRVRWLRGRRAPSSSAGCWIAVWQAARKEGTLAASVVALTEIVGGMRSPERRGWLLISLRTFPVNDLIGYRAGEFRRRYRRSHSSIGMADYLIAATAEVHGLPLATLNVKHFPMFRGLRPPFEPG